MKRYNHLLSEIVSIDNLYTAYWKARKGKEAKLEVICYSKNLDKNIEKLQEELLSGNIRLGDYHYFTIFDPKERLICAAPFHQRVLHHALMNICGPKMNKRQILDSFASQKGKGTYAALERAKYFHRKYDWCIKMDIRKYFDSISHVVLKQQIASLFKETHLQRIFFSIIDSYDSGIKNRGLPLGNLTSQFFANHYLSSVDHYAYEQIKVSGYVRYMDDILIYAKNRSDLLHKAQFIRIFIETNLLLSFKVFDIKSTSMSTQFLGYRLTNKGILLSQRSKRRFRMKVNKYKYQFNLGYWSELDYQHHLFPLISFVMKANSFHFRKNVIT